MAPSLNPCWGPTTTWGASGIESRPTFRRAAVEHPVKSGEHDLRLDSVGADQPAIHGERPLEPVDEPLTARDAGKPARELPGIVLTDQDTADTKHPTSLNEQVFV